MQVGVALGDDRAYDGGVYARLDLQHVLQVGPVCRCTYLHLLPRHVGLDGAGFFIRECQRYDRLGAVLDVNVVLVGQHVLQFRVKDGAQGSNVVVRTRTSTAAKMSDTSVGETGCVTGYVVPFHYRARETFLESGSRR